MSLSDTLLQWCTWLENTPVAIAIAESSNLFPLIETAHVVGLTLVFGTIAIVDLRLLDLASRDRPVSELVEETLPWTWGGFVLALTTGALMFISRATTYFANVPFRIKLALLLLAGLNMAAFHVWTYRSVERWPHTATPRGAKIAGASSMVLWICVIFAGRWIAFTE